MSLSIVTRFAPSPTGYLHLGHAASALIAHRRAREAGGGFLLRIEDIDRTRCRPDFTAAILEDLASLGLDWDGDVRIQSEHMDDYRGALSALDAMGLLYPCFCTRAEIAAAIAASASAPHGPDAPYPGTCRTIDPVLAADRIASGTPYALRLRMDTAFARCASSRLRYHEDGQGWLAADPRPAGDIVLARKDVPASYHLCVTHDDALQGVTLVTRGEDLRSATPIHVLLQALFGWPTPAYAHHKLLTDETGRRLAKRDRALTLRALRAEGVTPAEIREMISCRIAGTASPFTPS